MAERNPNPPHETSSRDELPDQLRQLQDAHTAHGSSLERAFTSDVRGILQQLSDEDTYTFFEPLFSREASTDTSRTTDSTESTSRPSTPIPPEDTPNRWNPRNVFKFLHDEFMTVQESQRMATFHNFLNRAKETANKSEIVSVVTTVKDAVASRFDSVRVLGRQMFGGAGCSFSGQRPTEHNVSNPDILGGAHQLPSTSTPVNVAGNTAGIHGTVPQPHPSVILNNPGYPGGTRPSELNRLDRSRSCSASPSSSPSSRNRNPLRRQNNVKEEDEGYL